MPWKIQSSTDSCSGGSGGGGGEVSERTGHFLASVQSAGDDIEKESEKGT